ncbi:MAG TPA: NifB/NifX family molybdenum-iron cluster-binding protein [Bacteroidales bacterium]|nr:NifB/NifX family molybdenum-iron cluster-binding protein [Bacteroidales bacterium]HPS73777.1 NifB/NifX family molybdenum-iron cluster-binding protein [Bacteroidales bacterium]
MTIAIAEQNGNVNEHFGHAEQYVVYTLSPDNKVVKTEYLKSEGGCGCHSGIAEKLASMGVTLMLAGNIGAGAIQHLYMNGIDVIRGCSGNTAEVLQAFLNGQIHDNNQTCHQHEGCDHEHEQGHHHAAN